MMFLGKIGALLAVSGVAIARPTARDQDPQSMYALHESQVMPGIAQAGEGSTRSQTSTNNFINFCMTRPDLPLTNGQQITTGSCNPTVMGVLAGQNKMVSSRFIHPKNFGKIPANKDFLIQMKINNLATGNFVNANSNYFGAPQNTDMNNTIIGHTHFVIERVNGFTSTQISDPTEFAFFKGVNAPANNGVLTDIVAGGLPSGTYKLSSMNSAANHFPVLSSVSQHGSHDDVIYFEASKTMFDSDF